ncbi:MAG: alpha/beta hydrolase [Cyclobacteriaceae bacterium]|nr:alpha/beta hydrolase [Cyclobacteriaceae bacterium]
MFRKVRILPTDKERISTLDEDFLDLDWFKVGSDKLIIISHGLEGSSNSEYVKGMAQVANTNNIDALGWNYRGCSDQMNLTTKFYHSGATYDLQTVIAHAVLKGYSEIALVGFSLGGNLTLKLMGELEEHNQPIIKCAAVFSVPMDLSAGSDEIQKPKNKLYSLRFLKRLRKKLKAKYAIMGNEFPLNDIDSIKSLREFDNSYTGPLHGFKDANDYYAKSSSLFYLNKIKRPTLIVNAINDPFLPNECYPYEQLKTHKYIWFETPKNGGHVGFGPSAKDGSYWSERRAYEFMKEYL